MTTSKRKVVIAAERGFAFGDFQMNYLNYRDWRIIPSTAVYFGDQLVYESNRLGCKGPEIDATGPVAAIVGDSVVHGGYNDSFPHHVRLPGYDVLNGGVEGQTLPRIVDRTLELAKAVDLRAALVHTGWHNLTYNDRGAAFWTGQLDRLAGVAPLIAHFRLTADLSDAIVEPGYDAVLGKLRLYDLWWAQELSTVEGRRGLKAAVDDFNTFLEGYCAENGRLLIDLEPVMAPRSVDELGLRYSDFVHPAPIAYAEIARAIEAQVAPHLPPARGA